MFILIDSDNVLERVECEVVRRGWFEWNDKPMRLMSKHDLDGTTYIQVIDLTEED